MGVCRAISLSQRDWNCSRCRPRSGIHNTPSNCCHPSSIHFCRTNWQFYLQLLLSELDGGHTRQAFMKFCVGTSFNFEKLWWNLVGFHWHSQHGALSTRKFSMSDYKQQSITSTKFSTPSPLVNKTKWRANLLSLLPVSHSIAETNYPSRFPKTKMRMLQITMLLEHSPLSILSSPSIVHPFHASPSRRIIPCHYRPSNISSPKSNYLKPKEQLMEIASSKVTSHP